MKQLIIIVLLVALSAIVTLSTTDKLIVESDGNNKTRQIFKKPKRWKLSVRFFLLSFAFLGIIGTSIWQFFETQSEERERKREALNDQDRRDSIAELKSNRRNDSTVKTITEALAKYNLAYDSANKRIEQTLRDSLRNQKTIPIGPDPVLRITGPVGEGIILTPIDNSSYKIQLSFYSNDAASTDFKINASFVLSNSFGNVNDYIYLMNINALPRSVIIPTDGGNTAGFTIPIYNIPTDNYLFVLIRGTYRSYSSGKLLNVDQLYYHNVKGKTHGTVSGETEQKIREFITKNEKSKR